MIFKNKKKKIEVCEFNEKNISNSLKQNTGIKETKTKVTPVSSPKSLNSNAAFIIKETHPDRVNKCDQILKSRIFFWRLFLRDDIKLYTI